MTWDEVCTIAQTLPLVTSASYHGYPALRANGKFLARLGDDSVSIEFKSLDPDEREMLLATMPEVFYLPPRFRGNGVFARLSAIDEPTLRALLEPRWRKIGPKHVVAQRETPATDG